MEMNIVVFAKLFADTCKLRTIKPRAKFCGGIRAQKRFDPLSPEKIVDNLRVSPQKVTQPVSITGNEGNPDFLQRGSFILNRVLHLCIRK